MCYEFDIELLRSLRQQNKGCTDCSLRSGCNQVVIGQVPGPNILDKWYKLPTARIMVVGEAPGYHEDKKGIPFIGPSGNELDHYLTNLAGIPRSSVYVTNVVKCRPFNNANPSPESIKACYKWLDAEINIIKPTYILALGRFAARWFLGNDFDMERGHGIPQPFVMYKDMWAKDYNFTVFPCYHPAAGLHERDTLQYIQEDLRVFGKVVRGEYVSVVDKYPEPVYKLHTNDFNCQGRGYRGLEAYLSNYTTIAIDTEDAEDGSVWCYSISGKPGTGIVVMGDDDKATSLVAWRLGDKTVTTVMHYGMHDLPRLATIGIIPANYTDTIIKAYLLGNLPQGLKALAYRLCGMVMSDYNDMIREVRLYKVLEWLLEVSNREWPDSPQERIWSPDPKKEKISETRWVKCTKRHKDAQVCPQCQGLRANGGQTSCSNCGSTGYIRPETKTTGTIIIPGTERGYWRWKQPQNIQTKVNRMLLDFCKSQEGGGSDHEPVDLMERWGNLSDAEKSVVEGIMGKMPTAWLAEIPLDNAVVYSARDADATLRVNAVLDRNITEMGLDSVLQVDTAIIPLLNEMMKNGMKVDTDHFAMLSEYYQLQLQNLHEQIADLFPHERDDILNMNLGSSDTLIWLLYDKCKLTPPAFTKKENKPSTASEDLSKLKSKHPVAELIIKYGEMKKLKTSFADAIPRLVGKDGRVHPQIKATRVVTGRLSMAKPNLMQIPSRSEEAANIQRGFIEDENYVILKADYSGIEMRVLAHESLDERMLSIFWGTFRTDLPEKIRTDMHTLNAADLFGVDPLMVRANKRNEMMYRYPSKTISFGLVYGLTAIGLVDQLTSVEIYYSEKECQKMIDMFLGELYPGVLEYFGSLEHEIRRTGMAREKCLNRIRRIPGVHSSLPWVVDASLREGKNMFIQGYAQGIIKTCMGGVMELPAVKTGDAACLLQLHDALFFKVRRDIVEEFAEGELRPLMENAHPLIVPTPVDIGWGINWAEA